MLINDKVDAVYIPDSPSRIKATDYNQIKNEIQECITEAGLTPTKDVIQLPQALKILTVQSAKTEVDNAINSLQMVKWVDSLPETGESKYIYAVPREETDTDGKQIAALYLWDGTRWNGAGAFSLNIDPDTLATKTELTNYLPLTGGTLSGRIEINTNKDGKISLFNNNNFIGTIIANGTSSSPNLIFENNTGGSIGISRGSGIFLKRENMQSGSYILCNADKAVANGVASLDANTKVPSAQIPTATTSALGGVKPDGATITVTEDGTISASVSGEGLATKAELQDKVSKAGDTMTGTLKMSGGNEVRFGTDDNFYYIKKHSNGDLLIYNKDSKGLFFYSGNNKFDPYYFDGTKGYRLLTTADLDNIDYVVERYNDGAGNWYRKYKSGWLEQGGLAYSSSGDAVVTLLKPYADTGFAVMTTNEKMSNINAYGWTYITSKTTTGFTVLSRRGNGDAVTCNAMWEAKGQGAN